MESQKIMKRQSKNKVGNIIRPNLKLSHRVMVINKAWYWNENMRVDQWNGIKDLEVKQPSNAGLIFDKGSIL